MHVRALNEEDDDIQPDHIVVERITPKLIATLSDRDFALKRQSIRASQIISTHPLDGIQSESEIEDSSFFDVDEHVHTASGGKITSGASTSRIPQKKEAEPDAAKAAYKRRVTYPTMDAGEGLGYASASDREEYGGFLERAYDEFSEPANTAQNLKSKKKRLVDSKPPPSEQHVHWHLDIDQETTSAEDSTA